MEHTRFATVIPFKSKQPPDILAGVLEGMQKSERQTRNDL